jgi:hypothetical protein
MAINLKNIYIYIENNHASAYPHHIFIYTIYGWETMCYLIITLTGTQYFDDLILQENGEKM